MQPLLRTSMLTSVAVFFITQANAAQPVPADTATFVAYCTDATLDRKSVV